MPDNTLRVARSCRATAHVLFALIALTACRNVDAPEHMRGPGSALAVKSGIPDTLPFQLSQTFHAGLGAQPIACGTQFSVPSRLAVSGVFAPHMGRVTGTLSVTSCDVAGGASRLFMLDTLAGATGDSVFGTMLVTVGSIHDGTAALSLEIRFRNGFGWFERTSGRGTGMGTIDIGSGSGSFSGSGTIGPQPRGVMTTLIPETITTGADDFACGLTVSGAAYCWGNNSNGELGDGTTTAHLTPVAVSGGLTFAQIDAGFAHVCARTVAGDTYCWGWNAYGQLGTGDVANHAAPTLVVGGHAFAQIDAGHRHTCGITPTGAAYCWGYNAYGALGDGSTIDRRRPVAVRGNLEFDQITAGAGHTCAVSSMHDAYCWGLNDDGQLGDSTTTDRQLPTLVAGGHSFVQISGSFYHTCALQAQSFEAYCWGSNSNRQLANGDEYWGGIQVYPRPVIGDYHFNSISTGYQHTCGVTTMDTALCWGDNILGELGIGSNLGPTTPGPVSTSVTFTQIQAGDYFTCAVADTRVAYCWGENTGGQLGNGTTSAQYIPTAIAAPQFRP